MGLTYFMLDQSRKEAEYCMENAFHTYLVRVVSLKYEIIWIPSHRFWNHLKCGFHVHCTIVFFAKSDNF